MSVLGWAFLQAKNDSGQGDALLTYVENRFPLGWKEACSDGIAHDFLNWPMAFAEVQESEARQGTAVAR